jgi:hypothetical protein
MPYVKVITETKPANCSPSFRWMFFGPNSNYKNIFEYRKKYYVDTGLILSNTVEFKNSNNQICSSNNSCVSTQNFASGVASKRLTPIGFPVFLQNPYFFLSMISRESSISLIAGGGILAGGYHCYIPG